MPGLPSCQPRHPSEDHASRRDPTNKPGFKGRQDSTYGSGSDERAVSPIETANCNYHAL